MKILKSDRILFDIENKTADAVIVPMSVYNSMNSGFAYDIALNFPSVKEKELLSPYGDKRKYGTVNVINDELMDFLICYCHNGGYNKELDGRFIDYDNLKKCLTYINKRYSGKKIISPILGVSQYDGNGDKNILLKILEDTLKDTDLIIYDFEQKDTKLFFFHKIAELRKLFIEKVIDSEAYQKKRSEIEWKRRYGLFIKMPDDYRYQPKGRKKG